MPRSTKNYRIFVASPGDVQREREAMQGVVNAMNRILEALLPDDGIAVELLMWERNVAPHIIDGPQHVVNEQIDSYDIFLGLLARRFGTRTEVAESGTEEEFRRAYETWRKHGMPWIVFFFNTRFEPPQEEGERAQWDKVKAFRAELDNKGIAGEYNGADLFMSTVVPPLLQIIGSLVKQEHEAQSRLPLPQAPSVWTIAGQPVPLGKKVNIVAIGEKDACYHRRDKYIGRTGIVLEAQRLGPWLRGTFEFERPLFDGDDGRYTFLQFQVESQRANATLTD
jgi:hypothetical protein